MATITSFEELKCWQLSRQLVKDIYKLTDELPISKDYALKDQMRRSAISIMSNIAEGFGRSGNKEFIQFLSIAKGSITELHSQLFIALDCEYLNKDKFDSLTQKSAQATSAIGGMIRYLKSVEHKGYKFMEVEETYEIDIFIDHPNN